MSEREMSDHELEREAMNGSNPKLHAPKLEPVSRAVSLSRVREELEQFRGVEQARAAAQQQPSVLEWQGRLEASASRTQAPPVPVAAPAASPSDYFTQVLQKAFDDGRLQGAREERERIGRALLGT